MKKESVPLKKVILKTLGEVKSAKYLKGLDFAYIDAEDIYQNALSNLLNGNTEKTLKCLIFGLDIDRENLSLLHLARTMLFSLSEDFHEGKGDIYRQKYNNDLNKALEQLSKKLENENKKIEELNHQIDLKNKEIEVAKKNFITFLFKRSRLNSEFKSLELQKINLSSEIENIENEIDAVNYLIKIEDYMKILSIVLEVCIFPSRFFWVLSNK